MQLRIGLMLSWLAAWVLAVLLFWINFGYQDEDDLDKLKEISEFQIAAGVIGLLAGLVGGGILLMSKFTLMKNLTVNGGAWLGFAFPIYFIVAGYQLYRVFNLDETFQQDDKDYELAIALTNFLLACLFFLMALVLRGQESAMDRGIFSIFHTAAVLATGVAFMLFCWQLYSNFECVNDSSKTASDCEDDQKAWYSIIMITSFAAAGVALLSALMDKFSDGIILGTVAIAALFGAYVSILLSNANGDCDNEQQGDDCFKNAMLSGGTIGGVASAVLFLIFCMRSAPVKT